MLASCCSGMSHETYYIAGQRAEQKKTKQKTKKKKNKQTSRGFFFFAARAPERFEILGGSRDLLVVFGAWRCWRVERPQNSGRKWLPSGCLRGVGTLTRGASSKFWAQVATLSLFLTRRDAGAWSVFEIQGVSGHPLVVFGAS